MKRPLIFFAGLTLLLAGCSHNSPPPVMLAPPSTPVTISQPLDQTTGAGQAAGVYNWTDVPAGQPIPISRAVFDQGGYQLYSPQGTIVVPFASQNLYVMKFGQSQTGSLYFVNSGQFPTLFIPPGAGLQNAAQPGSNWYPFPQNYNYTQPVYVGLAPSWSAFTGMGWYPGMAYYGGYYGYSPYSIIGPMAGLHFLIGGSPYYGWNSYHSYYTSHPSGYAPMRVINRTVYNRAARTSFNSGGGFGRRPFGSAGTAFGGSRLGFGSGRSSLGGGGGSFGSGTRSFGSAVPRSPLGGAAGSGGSFGRGPSGFGGSFGAGRRSFPASAPPVSAPPAPSGGSFGSHLAFGGGRSSFGGGSSFGSGRSFGGGHSSFGGGRRR